MSEINISKILKEFDKLMADIGYRALHGKKYDSEKETKDFIKQSIEKCLDESVINIENEFNIIPTDEPSLLYANSKHKIFNLAMKNQLEKINKIKE